MGALAEFNLKLGKPTIVMTKHGEREVRNAPATEEFWTAWRADKDALKARGYSVSKAFDSGEWRVALWSETMSAEDRAHAHDASRAQDAEIDVPAPAGMELMPFQRAGIAYALKRDGTLIGDEMGLGKTIQAIVYANAIKAQRILVVAPASLLLNWKNEIERWQTLDLPVFVIRPGRVFTGKQPGWYVINYDIVGKYEHILKQEQPWDLFVADECQYLKSRTAQRTLTLLGGTRKNKETGKREAVEAVPAVKKLMLTGTPIMNRPAELFPILHALDGRRWPTWTGFARRYCQGGYNGFGYDANGASNLDELNARLRETVMVRRLKADVLTELPAKRRQIVALAVDDPDVQAAIDRENAAYERTEAMLAAANTEMLQAQAEGNEAAYKAAVAKLQQVRGVAFSEMARVRHETAVAKIPQVIEHLKAVEDKTLVFCWHRDVVDALCEALKDEGVVSITGDTPNERRQPIVEKFQTDPNIKFFIGNIKAAGVGLTLTASSHVVFAELDWTPSNITQAEDRAHRIGQRESVLVQHVVLDGSLDAKMAKMILAKQKVIDQALDAHVGSSEKPESEEEIRTRIAARNAKLASQAPDHDGSNKPIEQQRLERSLPNLTPAQIEAVQQALRIVAGYDDDRARQINGVGFSKMDTGFGCDLASKSRLTPRQAAAAMRMIRKYRRQYPAELYETIFGEAVA